MIRWITTKIGMILVVPAKHVAHVESELKCRARKVLSHWTHRGHHSRNAPRSLFGQASSLNFSLLSDARLHSFVLWISPTTLQASSACFFQTVTYVPFSIVVLPFLSLVANSLVPCSHARSPELATSTPMAEKLKPSPGSASISCHALRMFSLPWIAGLFGDSMMALSAKKVSDFSRSLD